MKFRRGVSVTVSGCLLAMTGCALVSGEEAGSAPGQELTAAADRVRAEDTLAARFDISVSATLLGGQLRGEAEVQLGGDLAASYVFSPTVRSSGDPDHAGEVRLIGQDAYTRVAPERIDDAGWRVMDRGIGVRHDVTPPLEWLGVVLSRLCDPLFLLDQGLAEVRQVGREPEELAAGPTTRYTVTWLLTQEPAGPELTAWGNQLGGLVQLDVTLWVAEDGRPVRLRANASPPRVLFDAYVDFTDYGVPVRLAAPDDAEAVTG